MRSKVFEFKSISFGPLNTFDSFIEPLSLSVACTTATRSFKFNLSRFSLVNSHASGFESIATQLT